MLGRLEEFLGAHGAHCELIAHKEAVMLPACCAIDMNRLKGLIGLDEIDDPTRDRGGAARRGRG